MNIEEIYANGMQARYRISERDYQRAGALSARATPRAWGAMAALALLLLAVVIWGPPQFRWLALLSLFGGAIGWSAMLYLVNPWLLRRHYRRYKAIQDELVVALLDDGLRFTASSGESRLTWDRIFKWRHDADYVLIYSMPRLYHVVPARVTAQGFDVARLKALLTCHVGPAR